MFTGIIETLGEVATLGPTAGHGWHLRVRLLLDDSGWELGEGESVAVNGVCLTVVDRTPGQLGFDLAGETLRVTTLGDLRPGDPLNLERPLRLDARLGGHLVLGHADGVGRIAAVVAEGQGRQLTIEAPEDLRPLLIPKGSVAVDGVSLTVAELSASTFGVALIPHTLAVTTLGRRGVGARVNLEMDVIGKYVRALMPGGEGARETAAPPGLIGLSARGQEARR